MKAPIALPASGELERLHERRAHYAKQSKAAGTWETYEKAWKRFETRVGTAALPAAPETVADYAIEMADAGLSPAYIAVALAAIGNRHRLANLPAPTEHPQLREILKGIARAAEVAKEAEPLMPEQLRKLVTLLRPGVIGARDLALLTIGLAGGFRRSELSAMQVDWVRYDGEGYLIRLPRSKSDQEGEGHERRICPGDHFETCPVAALRAWLAAVGSKSGPVFRPFSPRHTAIARRLSERRIDEIVRGYVRLGREKFGDALFPGTRYSAHSLRAGCVTACAVHGKPEWQIREHVGHKSARTTARYIRAAKTRVSTVTKGIGL